MIGRERGIRMKKLSEAKALQCLVGTQKGLKVFLSPFVYPELMPRYCWILRSKLT